MPSKKKDAPRAARRKPAAKPAKVEAAERQPMTILVGLGLTAAGRPYASFSGPEQQVLGRLEFDDSPKGHRRLKDGLDALAGWRRSPLLKAANYEKLRPKLAAIAKQQGGLHFHFRLLRTLLESENLVRFLETLPWPKTITHDEPGRSKPRIRRFPMRRIPVPDWAPPHARGETELDGVSRQEYESLQERRAEILALLDGEVERYVNENALPGDDSFPERDRLTGEFYIGSEKYFKKSDRAWFQVSIFCRCLEHPRHGGGTPDDYLGLEVYLRCEPGGGTCSVLDTDESSI